MLLEMMASRIAMERAYKDKPIIPEIIDIPIKIKRIFLNFFQMSCFLYDTTIASILLDASHTILDDIAARQQHLRRGLPGFCM